MERYNIENTTTITIHEKHSIYTMQLQLQFMERFNIQNTTTITIHEKHLNIHNAATIKLHRKHLIYTQFNYNYISWKDLK